VSRSVNRNIALTFAAFLISAAVIVALPVILLPEAHRGDRFWHRIAWTLFLAFLFWSLRGAFVVLAAGRGKSAAGMAGVLPVITMVVTYYVVASFVLMIVHALVRAGNTADKIYLVLQILVVAAAATAIVLMYFVRAGAIAGIRQATAGVTPPRELAQMLQYQEQRLLGNGGADGQLRSLQDMLRSLREKISYSLPNAAEALHASGEYGSIAKDVAMVCGMAGGLSLDNVSDEAVAATKKAAEDLVRRVEAVAAHLRR
jgi:hypothetical protein